MAVLLEKKTMRSPALRLNLLILSWTGVLAFALLVWNGMYFDLTSATTSAATIVFLFPFAVAFDRRGIASFVNLLTGFLCMVAFNGMLVILIYAGTPLNAPLADDWLMRCDAAMGIHLPSIVRWMDAHPHIKSVFDAAYPSVMLSTLLALVVLGLDNRRWRMQEFILQFMLATLLTTLAYFLLPAAGPFAAYGYAPRPEQQDFLNHFHALRNGQLHYVSLNHVEGLITFPSFHTSWALLLAWAFRHYRWLRFPMLLLNLAVVISTLTTGWHYGTDVVGGLVVTVLAALATARLRPWLEENRPEADSADGQADGQPNGKPALVVS